MNRKFYRRPAALFAALALSAALIFTSCGGEAEGRGAYFITVLTGPTSGIFFPIGGAFSSHLGQIGYRTSVTATGATLENIRLLMGGQGELAIAMSDAVSQAYNAHGAFEGEAPADNLRVMMGLWPNYVQIVTTADSGITSFEDLRGRRVGVGAPGSGVELNARLIFEAHGMSYADIQADFLAYGQAIEQIQNGLADAAFVTSGLGNATIRQLGFTRDITFVPIEGEGAARLMETHPYFVASVIPAQVYETAYDVTTVSVMNVMLVDHNLPASVVYDFLENIYSEAGLALIHAAHSVAAQHIHLDTALRGLSAFTMHDGAAEFFRARGMIE